MSTLDLVLLRHGETTGESSIRLNGATDVPLSELGRAQMRAAGRQLERERLLGLSFDRVFTSPLSRARESAAIAWPDAPVEVVQGLSELDFGDWERLTYDEVRARDPERFAELRRGHPDFQFPGGESRRAFLARVAAAARHHLDAYDTPGRLLVVAHKGTIKALAAALLGDDTDARRSGPCDLASLHRLVRTAGPVGARWTCVSWNETGHLGPLHVADHNPGTAAR